MDAARKPVKRRLREYLEAERPAAINEEVWKGLLARLAPVSESYLRDLLRATGLPFEQPWAGVNQHSFEDLERSLRELAQVYAQAAAAGDRQRARYIRRLVIGAKGARRVRGAPSAHAAGEERSQRGDGRVDACVAGEPGDLPRLGGSSQTHPERVAAPRLKIGGP